MRSPDAPYWVELRVHGVSGTPAEAMLGTPHVRQVAGDDLGRVFRPVGPDGAPPTTGPAVLEGYHWGQFTSGSWRQGLWLLLIPFGLVNAAQFMLPHPGTRWERACHTVAGALLRLIGIGLTCTFAFTAGLLAIDVLGLRGAGRIEWLQQNVSLGVLAAAGTVVAGLVIWGLSVLGEQSSHRDVIADGAGGTPAVGCFDGGLTREGFFGGDPDCPTLRDLHLAAGLAVIGVLALAAAAQITGTPGIAWGGLAPAAVLAVAVLVTVMLGDPEQSASVIEPTTRRRRWHQIAATLGRNVKRLAVVLTGAAGLLLLFFPVDADGRGPQGLDGWAGVLAAVVGAAVVLLAVVCAVLAWLTRATHVGTPKSFRPYARGMAAWAAATTGVFVGVGFSGAFIFGTARMLPSGSEQGVDDMLQITEAMPAVARVAFAWGITLAVLAVIGLTVAGWLWRAKKRMEPEAAAAYAHPVEHEGYPAGLGRVWLWRVARAMGVAQLKHGLAAVLMFTASVGTLLTIGASVEMVQGSLPAPFDRLSAHRGDGPLAVAVINVGAWTLIGLAGLLVLLGRGALRAHGMRRGVNVVWDVLSFWPHAVHPFVPPAYSQYAVADLHRRIRFHLATAGAPSAHPPAEAVVLSAHSQGSLIAFATVLCLSQADRDRIGLLTYGSQLQVAFPRAFPAYVNHELIRQLFTNLDGRWINLYRDTDPIAGPVLSWDRTPMTAPRQTSHRVHLARSQPGPDGDADEFCSRTGRRQSGPDWRLLDPTPADPTYQTASVARLRKHSDYPDTTDYSDALECIVTVVAPQPVNSEGGDDGVPAHPATVEPPARPQPPLHPAAKSRLRRHQRPRTRTAKRPRRR